MDQKTFKLVTKSQSQRPLGNKGFSLPGVAIGMGAVTILFGGLMSVLEVSMNSSKHYADTYSVGLTVAASDMPWDGFPTPSTPRVDDMKSFTQDIAASNASIYLLEVTNINGQLTVINSMDLTTNNVNILDVFPSTTDTSNGIQKGIGYAYTPDPSYFNFCNPCGGFIPLPTL